jgi:hypothetical protein
METLEPPENADFLRREAAAELVGELAFAERTESEIRAALERAELSDALGEEKFNEVLRVARVARERVARPLGKILPRVVGVAAVLLGWVCAGTFLGKLAILFGLILIIKPSWRNEEVDWRA